MPITSAIASHQIVEGLQLQVGNGASPEVFTTIANVTDFNMPMLSDTVEVTNVGDKFKRRVATLLDLGKISFKVFWVFTEPSHMNAVTGAVRGIRYLWFNQVLANYKVIYPDAGSSTDTFPAYITNCGEALKTGGVVETSIELSNDGAPTLV